MLAFEQVMVDGGRLAPFAPNSKPCWNSGGVGASGGATLLSSTAYSRHRLCQGWVTFLLLSTGLCVYSSFLRVYIEADVYSGRGLLVFPNVSTCLSGGFRTDCLDIQSRQRNTN